MENKTFNNIILLLLVVAAIIAGYSAFTRDPIEPLQTPTLLNGELDPPLLNGEPDSPPLNGENDLDPPDPIPVSETPTLSEDQSAILANGETLLAIENNKSIFNYFRNTDLCDAANINTSPEREEFCEDSGAFAEITRFASIEVSPDQTKIGFTIESDILTPDTVAGIFYPERETGSLSFLTHYYLGNKFIGFSPEGTHFAYQGNCWEAKCGLYIRNAQTLAEVANINDPENLDERTQDAEFVRWVSENEVEYLLEGESQQESF